MIFCQVILFLSLVAYAQDVCIVGYVMDTYCINRGTLLDNPSVKTLEEPDRHSVHCLVDVEQCFKSGFEVLADPEISGETDYCRAWQLDGNGNDMVIQLAREIGSCSTCNSSGTLKEGFRATILGNANGGRNLQVTEVLPASVGCPDDMNLPAEGVNCKSGQQTAVFVHGLCMLLSWGFLLPVGVLSARCLKHRPDGFWFKIHRPMQMTGIVIATIGMIVALVSFDVFIAPSKSRDHGIIGLTVMSMGIFQPINAYFRPHVPPKGEEKPLKRFIWEILHKSNGYIAVLLGLVNVYIGTSRPAKQGTKTVFQVLYGISVGMIFIILVSYIWDGKKYVQQEQVETVNETEKGSRTDVCTAPIDL